MVMLRPTLNSLVCFSQLLPITFDFSYRHPGRHIWMVAVLIVVGAFDGVSGMADGAGGGPKDHRELIPNLGNAVPTTSHTER